MKITWQQTVMYVISVIGMVALVIGLAGYAKMSDGAIVGLIGGIGAVIVNVIILVRGQQRTTQTLEQQDVKLDRVVAQTNGLSHDERQEIAGLAAAEVIKAWKRGEV